MQDIILLEKYRHNQSWCDSGGDGDHGGRRDTRQAHRSGRRCGCARNRCTDRNDAAGRSDVGAEQTQLSEPGDRTATPQALNQAVVNVGEPWVATATIVELGEMGMTVALDDGSQVLWSWGPPFFWQAQGTLAAGDAIKIDGFYNGDQYHAAAVTQADGSVLALR